ncbi:MAG: hypothetical protein HY596_01425, partial [Candidatus Omnitrophica bacterium]|nr:hypothetical protein [Candidatus Omnitrophota bacterium]
MKREIRDTLHAIMFCEVNMISPHGGTLINRIIEGGAREQLAGRAGSLPQVALDAVALSDVEMIAIGGFSPLEGFMTKRDYDGVINERRLASGAIWT